MLILILFQIFVRSLSLKNEKRMKKGDTNALNYLSFCSNH